MPGIHDAEPLGNRRMVACLQGVAFRPDRLGIHASVAGLHQLQGDGAVGALRSEAASEASLAQKPFDRVAMEAPSDQQPVEQCRGITEKDPQVVCGSWIRIIMGRFAIHARLLSRSAAVGAELRPCGDFRSA